jgi:hypothetical protein
VINLLKINLKKQAKLTEYCPIKAKKKTMIILDMLPLKMEVVDKEVSVDLEDLMAQIFQISLKIFSVILVVAEEVIEGEVLAIEVRI